MKLTENTKVRIKVPKHMYEAIQAELAKKHEMEEGYEEKVEEDVTRGAEIVAKDMMGAISSGDPFMTGVALVGAVVAGVIAGPKVVDTIKGYWKALTQKDPAKADKLAAAAEKAGLDVDGVKEGGYETEMEEALDMETLMEAVKDIAKKKADAKKKEAEAKKKKEAEDKKKADEKKKEAEAKKKAAESKKK
jgi:hypothetical protein